MSQANLRSVSFGRLPEPRSGDSAGGHVLGVDGATFRVRVGKAVVTAGQAASCMLQPEIDDEVWLCAGESGWHIGAVLTRGAGEAVLNLPPQTVVRATERLRFESQTVAVFAEQLDAGLGVARVVARRVDAALDSLATRAKQAFRWIDELEQVRAGQIDMRADGNVRVQGENALVAAERLVQVRGEEVHLS